MFLLDTNVISALAPLKRETPNEILQWLDQASPYLFLSVITAAEVTSGIAKAEREGASTKARHLREWWQLIEHLYAERLLPLDLACAHAAGKIIDKCRAHQPGFEDIAIAATAQAHGLTILSRNLRHFKPLGVPVLNPFEKLPSLP